MDSRPTTARRWLATLVVVLAVAFAASPDAGAQINVLTVDCTPFVSPGPGSFGLTNTMGMALQAVDQGADFNVTEVTPAAFRALTAVQLAAFDLIAVNNHPQRLGDNCVVGAGTGLGTTWHGVVGVASGGRVVLTSHDAPRFKLLRTPPAPPLFTGFEPFGTIDLVRQAALWAGGAPGQTGLLIFNDAPLFVGGFGWNNPELNLPLAWAITDLNQNGAFFMNGGYTDILPAYAAHPIYTGLSDVRGAFNTISSFSANIGDTSFHSVFGSFNPLIFTPTEAVINAGIIDVLGLCFCAGNAALGPDGSVITLIRDAILNVVIDVKPGSFPNAVNVKSKGVIPVAILTTSTAAGDPLDFDATTVDPSTVAFGPAGAGIFHAQGHVQDADGDGDLDLVLHFKTQQTGIACGDAQVGLTGQTFGGTMIAGSDSIKTVPCK